MSEVSASAAQRLPMPVAQRLRNPAQELSDGNSALLAGTREPVGFQPRNQGVAGDSEELRSARLIAIALGQGFLDPAALHVIDVLAQTRLRSGRDFLGRMQELGWKMLGQNR